MRTITLGRTGLLVSRVAFGTWQLGGDWGATDSDAAVAAIRRAADLGVNFFDTAHAYGFGASERLLAEALKGRVRDELVIATKGGLRPEGSGVGRDASATLIRTGLEESLRALDTDYVDLFQVHWPDPKTPFEETAENTDQARRRREGPPRGRVQLRRRTDREIQRHAARRNPAAALPPLPSGHRSRDPAPYAAASTAHRGLGLWTLACGLLGGHLQPDTECCRTTGDPKNAMFHEVPPTSGISSGRVTVWRLATEELGVTLAPAGRGVDVGEPGGPRRNRRHAEPEAHRRGHSRRGDRPQRRGDAADRADHEREHTRRRPFARSHVISNTGMGTEDLTQEESERERLSLVRNGRAGSSS